MPANHDSGVSIFYLHGGGYSFYPKSFYDNLAAMIALSARSKLFAVDYRLSPEHKFPAQTRGCDSMRTDGCCSEGADPRRLVVLETPPEET